MSLEDIYILVHLNAMLIIFLHALFIVYLVFYAEFAQHAYALCFGVHSQSYELN